MVDQGRDKVSPDTTSVWLMLTEHFKCCPNSAHTHTHTHTQMVSWIQSAKHSLSVTSWNTLFRNRRQDCVLATNTVKNNVCVGATLHVSLHATTLYTKPEFTWFHCPSTPFVIHIAEDNEYLEWTKSQITWSWLNVENDYIAKALYLHFSTVIF